MEDDGVSIKNRLKMFEAAETPAKGPPPKVAINKPFPANKPTVGATKPTVGANKPTVGAKTFGNSPGVPAVALKPTANKWGGGGGLNVVGNGTASGNKDHNQNVVSSNSSSSSSGISSAKSMFEKNIQDGSNSGNSSGVGSSSSIKSRFEKNSQDGSNSNFNSSNSSGVGSLAGRQNGVAHNAIQGKALIPPKPLTPPKYGAKTSQVAGSTEKTESNNTVSSIKPSEMGSKSGHALASFLQKQSDNVAEKSPLTSTASSSSSTSSTSSSSVVSSDTSGPHDFRSNLRRGSANTSTNQTPFKPSTGQSATTPPPTPPNKPWAKSSSESTTSSTTSTGGSSSVVSQWKDRERKASTTSDAKPPLPRQISNEASDDPNSVTLRNTGSSQKRQGSACLSGVLERKADGKKFRKVKVEDLPVKSPPPSKPALPSGDLDLGPITEQYHKAIIALQENANKCGDGSDLIDDDDIYDIVINSQIPRQSMFRKASQRVSMIEEMTAEEEGVEELIYDDALTPAIPGVNAPASNATNVTPNMESVVEELIYDEGYTPKPEDEIEEELYEDEESIKEKLQQIKKEETEQDKKKQKLEEEARKKEEKERREREKEEEKRRKKEEKERLNREREDEKQRKRFQMTGDEVDVGEGVISQNAKGKKDNLPVTKGQKVTIVRLDKNPSNKWLVRNENQQLGYVDSNIIDIDPNIIRELTLAQKEAMERTRKATAQDDDDDQPTYDDVPGPGEVVAPVVDEYEDKNDIYEEFN